MNRYTQKVFVILTIALVWNEASGQEIPKIEFDDKVRIKEAFNIVDKIGEQVWEGIAKVPFAVLFVTDSVEFLISHPNPSEDFTSLGYDSFLEAEILYRPQQTNKYLLATYPAVNGISTVVMGTPKNTNKSSTDWIITLLHEHFHQYQTSTPGYYASVEKLDLTGGDTSGMWMLNYPFPYDDEKVIEAYRNLTTTLNKTVASIGSTDFEKQLETYIEVRSSFKALLDSDDYRYFSFQIWQEGIARYTEYEFLRLMESYQPLPETQALSDFTSYKDFTQQFHESQFNLLTGLSLSESKRVCFYSLGFAEGILINELDPNWQDVYLPDTSFLEQYNRSLKK